MKNTLLIILIFIYSLSFSQVKGKILNVNLQSLAGVKITNLNTGKVSHSDPNGCFKMEASAGESLRFEFPGLTSEKIEIIKNGQDIHLIMIDKDLNCIGQTLSQKQIEKNQKIIRKKLKKLYRKARKQKIWQAETCL